MHEHLGVRHQASKQSRDRNRNPRDAAQVERLMILPREKLSLLCLRRKTTREKDKKGEGYFVSHVESTNLT